MVVYFGPFYLFGMNIGKWRFPAIITGFALNYGAYFAEIYRDLIATDLPVGTLAEKHGFTNDKLFHRLFRERFHTTPLQLRKAAREKGS